MVKSVVLIGSLMVILAIVTVACGGSVGEESQLTITVEEAKASGYSMFIEPCSNRAAFSDLYIGVPFKNVGSGNCEMYYSPKYMEATQSCLDQFPSVTFQEYAECAIEALGG